MKVSKRFGELILEIKQDDSFGMAAIKTGISKAYLVEMAAGKVPSEAVIQKYAKGYADRKPDLHALMVAAGYEEPHPKDMYSPDKIVAHLRAEGKLSPEAIKEIEDLLKEVEDAHNNNRPHN